MPAATTRPATIPARAKTDIIFVEPPGFSVFAKVDTGMTVVVKVDVASTVSCGSEALVIIDSLVGVPVGTAS